MLLGSIVLIFVIDRVRNIQEGLSSSKFSKILSFSPGSKTHTYPENFEHKNLIILCTTECVYDYLMQMGRKNVLLFGTLFNFICGLAVAALIQFKDDINGAPYVIVVLISAYGFSYTGSWLYVQCTFSTIIICGSHR